MTNAQPTPPAPQPAYQPPRVTPLGRWQALTLQITVPISPGGYVRHSNRF